MSENILEKIIEKKIIKITNLKKTLTLESLKDIIDKNDTFIDFKERIENLEEINEETIITRAVMEPKKLLNVISKQKNKNLKIIMMVSEPVEISYPNWESKFLVSEAQRILDKNRGFLNITPIKN